MANGKGAPDFTTLYIDLFNAAKSVGVEVTTRGKTVKEMENVGMLLENPLKSIPLQKARKFNTAYAVIEMLGLFMPGAEVVDTYLFYNPNMENFVNPETRLFDGSYAERLTMYDQLRYCYKVLKQDPNTRRAVLDFYNAAHDEHESLDICCTLNVLFRVRKGKLNTTTFMRGNDIVWGTPYNFVMFTWLQNVMSKWLGVELGDYFHQVGSAHYYLDKEDEVDALLAEPRVLRENPPLEELPRWDLEDVEETFADIKKFFEIEKGYRKYLLESDVSAIIDVNELKSQVLRDLFENVIKPAAIRNAKKLGKNVSN